MTEPNAWSIHREGDVAVLQQDDGKGNAYTTDGLTRLNELLDQTEGTAAAVILEGRPGFFSAGFDLETIKEGGRQLDTLLALGAQTFARILTHPLPVIAACTGHALAAGSLILLAADFRVAAAGDFKIGLNEVAIGSPLPNFLIELARYRMPPAGIEAVLRGETLPPETAEQYGYLDVVVAPDVVAEAARRQAQRLMRLRRGVFAAAKKALRAEVAGRMLANLDADVRLLNPRNAKGAKARQFVSSQTSRHNPDR